MAHVDVDVPALVEEVMTTYELTQAELAEAICRDQSAVSHWKRGKTVPDELVLHILQCPTCREHFFQERRDRKA